MDFSNKTVLVTGAGVGIGKAAAMLFAERGANVVMLDFNADTLNKAAAEVKGNVLAVTADISDEVSVKAAVKQAEEKFGSIDILVNNAAIWRYFSNFEDIPIETWQKFININIMGAVYCIDAVLPKMKEKRYGRIISVASVAGVYGNRSMTVYSATKGAIIAMTRALGAEVAEFGITVNCTSPGSVSPSENPDIDYVEQTKLSFSGRTGSDRENAELICFLASDGAAYINSQNIQIDGSRMAMGGIAAKQIFTDNNK